MFGRACSLIGCIHVLPLPGSARYAGSIKHILQSALADARAYVEGGVDAIIIENMHDLPYLNGYVDPETTAAMAMVAHAVRQEIGAKMPLGIQILAAANIEALGVAVAASLDFMRVEGYVFAHVGDEGIHQASAPKLVRRRATLKADNIKIFADIKKKHSAHSITSDITLVETAHAAEFFEADGVIVTGQATGIPPGPKDVGTVRHAVKIPVLVGSGVTPENVAEFASNADGLIVGSSMKIDGDWRNAVDVKRVSALRSALSDALRDAFEVNKSL